MIIFFYNITQLAILALFWPVLLLFLALNPKYRNRIPARLGCGLPVKRAQGNDTQRTFWVHALSVGEVTSAVPLISGIRQRYPESRIIVTVSTATGQTVAENLLGMTADHILPSPLDLLPVVNRYVQVIRPDIFILVETDYWPNLIAAIARHNIAAILVNGRISQKSFEAYKKFRPFFLPMFRRFDRICLQTEIEKEKFQALGVDPNKLFTLGNLKYDLPDQAPENTAIARFLPQGRLLFIAGSTHRGEEEQLFSAYQHIRDEHPELYLILVPRQPRRAEEIITLGLSLNLIGARRTDNPVTPHDYLLVDTIGELVEFYRHSHIAFTGGSLVAAGGHNPLEPARMGLPVLFGPHMEDFQEIAAELVAGGGGRTITSSEQLTAVLRELVTDGPFRQQMGECARKAVIARQGVVAHHLDMLESLLK